MAYAEVGTTASDFSLLNQRGEKVSLKDYRGKKNIVPVSYTHLTLPTN